MNEAAAREVPVNVLLVDDKTENLLALESILEGPDYHLVRAQSGPDALLALLAHDYAAIVLDVQMPGMSGIELAQIIRGRKKTQHIPILFLTAHGDESAIAGYQAGAVDFMTKPVQAAVLRSKVAAFSELFRKSNALKAEIEERRQAEERIRQLNIELSDRVEDLAAANSELESFSYTVSHDLRAPLRQVSGFVSLLEESLGERKTPPDAEYIDLIQNAVTRMGHLIDDLLAFSRVGRIEINREIVNLERLVEQVRQTLAPAASGRDIQWTIGSLPEVEGDPAMLRQVVFSLLDNALKFTRTRSPARIEIGARTEHGEHVFFVRDNGVGFDARHADKLFGVFQRLHTGAEFEGTGIGLASVRRIVQRHDGRSWAESVLGEGAAIYFSLPVTSNCLQ
ncbi:MAG TPA: response regulator [Burkholderiales bacterium]|nr:response regulator [Burkholderiales bacterium]